MQRFTSRYDGTIEQFAHTKPQIDNIDLVIARVRDGFISDESLAVVSCHWISKERS